MAFAFYFSQFYFVSLSNVNKVCNKTFAPLAMSLALVNSLGEWLIPPILGTKIIPTGAINAMSCASWPAHFALILY